MSAKTLGRLAFALLLAAMLLAVGAFWWWALKGMSEEVGSAWLATCCALGAGAVIALVASAERS